MRVITVPGSERLGVHIGKKDVGLQGVIPLISMMLNYEGGSSTYNEKLERNPVEGVQPIISIPIGSGNLATYKPSVGFVYCGAVADITAFAKLVADIISAASYEHLQSHRALVSTPCMVTRHQSGGIAQTNFVEGKCLYEVPFDELERSTLPTRLVTVSNTEYRYPINSARAVFTWIFLPAKYAFESDMGNSKSLQNRSKFNMIASSIYFDNSGSFIGEKEFYRPLALSDFSYKTFNELNTDCVKNEGILVLSSDRPAEFIGRHRSFINMLASTSDYESLPNVPKKIIETVKGLKPYCLICNAPLSKAVVINGLHDSLADMRFDVNSEDNIAVCYWCWGSLDPHVSSTLKAYKAPQLFDYAAACATDLEYTSLPLIGTATPIKKVGGGFVVSIVGGASVIFTGKSLGSCPQVTDFTISQSQLPIFTDLNIAWSD